MRWYSTAAAAETVGMSRRWINYQIESGKLRARDVGTTKKQYRISEDDLREFMASHPEVEPTTEAATA